MGADVFEVLIFLEIVETRAGGGVVPQHGVERIERVADEDIVAALRVAAAAGEGAPFVGGIFGVAVACAVYFGDQPGAAEVVLEAGDVFALIAAGRFSEQNERGEDAVVGCLDADVAAV